MQECLEFLLAMPDLDTLITKNSDPYDCNYSSMSKSNKYGVNNED